MTEEKAVTQEEINELRNEVARIRRGEMPVYEETDEVKYVFIRYIDDMPVVGWDKEMALKQNARGDLEEWITLYLLDKEGKKVKREVKYLDGFIRGAEKVKCKILDEKIKKMVTTQGMTTRKKVDGWRTIDSGMQVPVKVITPEASFKVELPDGEELEISGDYVN